ncbi:hypothetical protein IGI04_036419 [Brassica rapa subsp. trilocularis]|uniref:Uncharacterized protein n=1 Tax=Brassica rapa subsp. trilocularis TaxID=1813537 RepID=A0ABQ7LEF5_BRACM|nr:hypothetical protein IGI04_036419 [Brassica rapa subsp. trilocularis]
MFVAVRGCQSAHTGLPCVSVSTHMTSVAVHQYTYQHAGPWTQHAGPSWGLLGDFGPRGLSVQYTQDVRGCPPAHTGRPGLSMAVCSTHRTSVTVHDVRGCPCVSVCVRQHRQDVRGCSSVYISARWSLDLARWPFSWTVRVILAHVGCLFSTQRMSVGVHQHTQDVRACPCNLSAHRGRPWLSVCFRVCPSVNTGRPWLSISTQISTLVLGLSMLTLPVDCSGEFGPRGLSVQYTKDVRGGPPAHTGRLWLYVAVRQHTQDVHGCPCVFMCVYGCPPAYTGRSWLSVAVCQHTQDHTQDVRGYPSVHISARWSLDSACWPFPRTVRVISAHVGCLFSRHRTSVGVRQHTQDVRGCLSAHTGHPWLSVCVRVCPSAHTGRPWLSISTHISTLVLGLSTMALPGDCLCKTQSRPPRPRLMPHVARPAHAPSLLDLAHSLAQRPNSPWPHGRTSQPNTDLDPDHQPKTRTVRLAEGLSWSELNLASLSWPSYSSTSSSYRLTRPSCLLAYIRLSLSFLMFLTFFLEPWPSRQILRLAGTFPRTMAVLTNPFQDWGRDSFGTSVGVRQHTQDVWGCPWMSVSTHRTSMTVRVCPSAHTGRPWVSVSTHRTFVCVRQHTHDVRGCPCVSVCVRQHTQDVRGCSSVYISTRWSLDLARWPFSWTVWVILAHVGSLFSTLRTSVGVRQHTQDVRGCPWLSVSTHRTSVAVRVCPCLSVRRHRTSVAVHQYTYQHVVPRISVDESGTVTGRADGPGAGRFDQIGLRLGTGSGQASREEKGRNRQWAVMGRLWDGFGTAVGDSLSRPLSLISAILVDFYSLSHRENTEKIQERKRDTNLGLADLIQEIVLECSWCVWACDQEDDLRQKDKEKAKEKEKEVTPGDRTPKDQKWTVVREKHHEDRGHGKMCGDWVDYENCVIIVAYCATCELMRFYLNTSMPLTLCLSHDTLVYWSNDLTGASPRTMARPNDPISDREHDTLGDFGPSGLSVKYTHDVCGCPPAHTGRPWLSASTHRTSVAVRQHTQDVCGCPCVSMGVRQHTQDVRGCSSAHTGRLCVSLGTHRTSVCVCQHRQDVRVCSCVSVSTQRTCVAVHQYTYQHAGPWTHQVYPSRGLFG